MLKKGVISQGVVCPIVREGADVVDVVINSVSDKNINDKDIIGITESIIARSLGLYVTVDDIARDIEDKFGANAVISLTDPLYSRNRFGMILKGIARAAKEIRIIMPPSDIVGNPSGVNPYTGVDITKYYKEICKEEGCKCVLEDDLFDSKNIISCKIRDWSTHKEYLKNLIRIVRYIRLLISVPMKILTSDCSVQIKRLKKNLNCFPQEKFRKGFAMKSSSKLKKA